MSGFGIAALQLNPKPRFAGRNAERYADALRKAGLPVPCKAPLATRIVRQPIHYAQIAVGAADGQKSICDRDACRRRRPKAQRTRSMAPL